jgi:hypothetical protein
LVFVSFAASKIESMFFPSVVVASNINWRDQLLQVSAGGVETPKENTWAPYMF